MVIKLTISNAYDVLSMDSIGFLGCFCRFEPLLTARLCRACRVQCMPRAMHAKCITHSGKDPVRGIAAAVTCSTSASVDCKSKLAPSLGIQINIAESTVVMSAIAVMIMQYINRNFPLVSFTCCISRVTLSTMPKVGFLVS